MSARTDVALRFAETLVLLIAAGCSERHLEALTGAAPDAAPAMACPTLSAADLVGHWSFDEGQGATAADASANHNDATLIGGATWSDDVPAPLARGFSVALDGVDDYLLVMQDLAPALRQQGTLCAWVRASPPADSSVLLSDSIFGSFDADGRFVIATDGKLYVRTTQVVADDRWHHVCSARDAATGRLTVAVDGALEPPGMDRAAPLAGEGLTRIGSNRNGDAPLHGRLDDVRVYARVLTPNEMQQLAAGRAPAPAPTCR